MSLVPPPVDLPPGQTRLVRCVPGHMMHTMGRCNDRLWYFVMDPTTGGYSFERFSVDGRRGARMKTFFDCLWQGQCASLVHLIAEYLDVEMDREAVGDLFMHGILEKGAPGHLKLMKALDDDHVLIVLRNECFIVRKAANSHQTGSVKFRLQASEWGILAIQEATFVNDQLWIVHKDFRIRGFDVSATNGFRYFKDKALSTGLEYVSFDRWGRLVNVKNNHLTRCPFPNQQNRETCFVTLPLNARLVHVDYQGRSWLVGGDKHSIYRVDEALSGLRRIWTTNYIVHELVTLPTFEDRCFFVLCQLQQSEHCITELLCIGQGLGGLYPCTRYSLNGPAT